MFALIVVYCSLQWFACAVLIEGMGLKIYLLLVSVNVKMFRCL